MRMPVECRFPDNFCGHLTKGPFHPKTVAGKLLPSSGLREGEPRIGSGLKYEAALSGVLLCGVRSIAVNAEDLMMAGKFNLAVRGLTIWLRLFELRLAGLGH